jgi:hypothetical protein
VNQIPFDPHDFFGYLASGLVVLVGMDIVLGFPDVLGRDLSVVDLAILLVAIYVAGQVVATPAKAVIEDGIVGKLLARPHVNLFRTKRPWVRWVLFPGFYKPLPESAQGRILARAQREGVRDAGEALFLHVRYHHQVLTDEKLMTKLGSFLNKYGFARNLAFTSFVVGVALLARSWTLADPVLSQYGWTAVVTGVLLFYRYLKFFRQYSYEMFNVFGGLS